MTDLDRLRAAYRDGRPGDVGNHLSEETWELLASDGLCPDERERALDHVLECPRCAETYRAVLVLRAGAVAFDPDAPAVADSDPTIFTRRKKIWGGLSVFALAAAVVMVAILPTDAPRGPAGDGNPVVVRSSMERLPPTPLAPVNVVVDWRTRNDLALIWTVGEPETPVVVEILDADGELIWTSPDTTDARLRWPPGIADRPDRFYWRVVATHSGGDNLASELVSFDFAEE